MHTSQRTQHHAHISTRTLASTGCMACRFITLASARLSRCFHCFRCHHECICRVAYVIMAGPRRVHGPNGPLGVALSAPVWRHFGYPRIVGMQGRHVAVYSAPLSCPLPGGGFEEPGFVYFSGTPGLAAERYAVHHSSVRLAIPCLTRSIMARWAP